MAFDMLSTCLRPGFRPGLQLATIMEWSAFRHEEWILFITAPLAWTTAPKRTEHNLIVYIGKFEAEVTNNRRLRSRYCTVEATRSIARPLSDIF